MAAVCAALGDAETPTRHGVVVAVEQVVNCDSPHPGEVRGEVQVDGGGNVGHEVVRDREVGDDADTVNGV